MNRRERLTAIALGVLAFVVYCLCCRGAIPPEAWTEIAEAVGLRAPQGMHHALVRGIAAFLAGFTGVNRICSLYVLAGQAVAALAAALVFINLKFLLHLAATPMEIGTGPRRLAHDLVCLVPAAAFAFSQTMLTAGEALNGGTLDFVIVMAAFAAYFTGRTEGGRAFIGPAAFLFGVATAETPLGAAAAVAAVFLHFRFESGAIGFGQDRQTRYQREVRKWRSTMCFLAGLVATVWIDAHTFVSLGGLKAGDFDFFAFIARYLAGYAGYWASAATVTWWALTLALVAVPFAVMARLVREGCSDEEFLSWRIGLLTLALGLLAVSQLGSDGLMWYRFWTRAESVRSPLLEQAAAFLTAATLTLSLAMLTFEVYFRDYGRLVRLHAEEAPPPPGFLRGVVLRRRILAVAMPAALVFAALPFGGYRLRGEMRACVGAALDEIARELRGLRCVFTDGAMDAGIELAAARSGNPACALAMMDGNGAYERYLRLRAAKDEADVHSLELSTANAYRDWVLNRPRRVAECGFMIGFEMWRSTALAEPEASGFLMRTEYPEGDSAAAGAERARALAERMLALSDGTSPARRRTAGGELHRCFSTVLWRLARLAVVRGRAAGLRGDNAAAAAEMELATRLDAANPYLEDFRLIRKSILGRPREGISARENLQVALLRADFATAAIYAKMVLEGEPRNSDAHFGLGMAAYFRKDYELAREHLAGALETKPRDGVIWNNLAMAQLALGRLDEAEESAKKGVALLPGSTSASNTLLEIRKAKEKGK